MTGGIAQRLVVATLADRSDLLGKVFGPGIQTAMPEFVRHDPIAGLYYGNGALFRYLEYALVAVDPAEPGRPVARPFAYRSRFATAPRAARRSPMAAGMR
jgi:hypothetical protein